MFNEQITLGVFVVASVETLLAVAVFIMMIKEIIRGKGPTSWGLMLLGIILWIIATMKYVFSGMPTWSAIPFGTWGLAGIGLFLVVNGVLIERAKWRFIRRSSVQLQDEIYERGWENPPDEFD